MKRTYKVVLEALGPIFIGSGEKLKKFEYIYDSKKNKAYILDNIKFTKFLLSKNMLDDFVNRINVNTYFDLYRYFSSNVGIDFRPFIKYSLEVSQFKISSDFRPNYSRKNSLNDLDIFVKNGFGNPYIPGSSLKGALRTVLLNKVEDDKADKELFRKLQISDSEPLSTSNLKIYQKIDYSKKTKGLPIYRECLVPGTKIFFTMSLDDKFLSIDLLKEKIDYTYKNYYIKWLFGGKIDENHIKGVIGNHPEELTNNGYNRFPPHKYYGQIIYIGGGSGFVSKTLIYKTESPDHARASIFQYLRNKFPAYKKMRSMPANVPVAVKLAADDVKYRNKVTGQKYLEIGKALIKFEEIQ